MALAVAHGGERILGGVGQAREARQVEEAAGALDGVDEAEDRVEPRAVGGVRFPRDDLTGERFGGFAGFGDELL